MKLIVPKYPNRAACYKANRLEILANGLKPVRAECDAQGNCTTCGEAGRCPGWHPAPASTMPDPDRFTLTRPMDGKPARLKFTNNTRADGTPLRQGVLFAGSRDCLPAQNDLFQPNFDRPETHTKGQEPCSAEL